MNKLEKKIPNPLLPSPLGVMVCPVCGQLWHIVDGKQTHLLPGTRCHHPKQDPIFHSQSSNQIRRTVFAGGCFWGVEEMMRKRPGVLSVLSGYTGGFLEEPTYEEVCTGTTGHWEAVTIFYHPQQTDYESLCKFFLEIHDPTQADGQGPDIGSQYRSAIFYLDEEQQTVTERVLKELEHILREKGENRKICTQLLPYHTFWFAEDYHQDYYQRRRTTPYCHIWQKKFP